MQAPGSPTYSYLRVKTQMAVNAKMKMKRMMNLKMKMDVNPGGGPTDI